MDVFKEIDMDMNSKSSSLEKYGQRFKRPHLPGNVFFIVT
jgi:hypothetical protein